MHDLAGSIIGYRKNGAPIRLQAGGAPEDGDGDGGTPPAGKTFSEEEVNRLLTRERDKLHGRLSKADESQQALATRLEELEKERAEREKAEDRARKAAEAARKKAEEAEMDAKALIDRRSAELQEQYSKQQDEWAQQVTTLRQQMEEREAIFTKEREFQALSMYTQQQISAHADEIAPELVKYITGNTKEEIDASVADKIQTTQEILAKVQGAQQAARAAMPGVSTAGFTPAGPLEGAGQPQQFNEQQLASMSMAEYAKHRQALGVTGRGDGVGLFG